METCPELRSNSRKVPCESSPASAGLELTAEALPKSAIRRAGLMREPQCFSTCLSVPGFAWLDRTDSKQASACWSVSVGGLPLEICPRIYDSVESPMQRSRTLTPTPAATLSCSPGESLVSSPGEQAIFPGFSRPGTHRWRPAQICDLARRPHAAAAESAMA